MLWFTRDRVWSQICGGITMKTHPSNGHRPGGRTRRRNNGGRGLCDQFTETVCEYYLTADRVRRRWIIAGTFVTLSDFFFFYFWHRPAGTRPVRPTRQNAYVTRVPTPWRRRNYCFTAKRHVRIYCPANNYRSFSPPIRPTWTGGRSRAEYTRKRVGSEHATWPLGTPPNVVIFLISVKDACEIYRHRCYRVVTELLRTHYYVSLSFFMSRPMAQSVSCGTIIFETCNLRD